MLSIMSLVRTLHVSVQLVILMQVLEPRQGLPADASDEGLRQLAEHLEEIGTGAAAAELHDEPQLAALRDATMVSVA